MCHIEQSIHEFLLHVLLSVTFLSLKGPDRILVLGQKNKCTSLVQQSDIKFYCSVGCFMQCELAGYSHLLAKIPLPIVKSNHLSLWSIATVSQ